MKLIFAFLCSAIGFLTQWREQWFAKPPPPEKVVWEHDRSWFHNYKNISTEWVRADSEFWSKFLSFLILILSITVCVQFIVHWE